MAKRTLEIDGEQVVIDSDDTKFSDRTLNQFFERVSGRIDYIGQKHADAQRDCLRKEMAVESLYASLFKTFKEDGKSDKTAEMFAKGDPGLLERKEQHIEARHRRDILYAHLQALNGAREDAHNRGHFIRAEMKHLNMDIPAPEGLEQRLDEILKDASEYQK